PIPPEQLRVFPADSDLPTDARNARIDQEFVPIARVEVPTESGFSSWKKDLFTKLHQMTFHHFPVRIPSAMGVDKTRSDYVQLDTEQLIQVRLNAVKSPEPPERVILLVANASASEAPPAWLERFLKPQDALYICEPRGLGLSRWTGHNPPNYVERAHYLLG